MWAPPAGSGAENGFWRILKATERSFLYLYDINLRGIICTSVPLLQILVGGLVPRDLRPCMTLNKELVIFVEHEHDMHLLRIQHLAYGKCNWSVTDAIFCCVRTYRNLQSTDEGGRAARPVFLQRNRAWSVHGRGDLVRRSSATIAVQRACIRQWRGTRLVCGGHEHCKHQWRQFFHCQPGVVLLHTVVLPQTIGVASRHKTRNFEPAIWP